MITGNGIHPALDCAVTCNSLRHAVRALAEDSDGPSEASLTLSADVLDQVARALDHHWRITRRSLEDGGR